MDCAEIRQQFLAGKVPAGGAVDAHRQSCAQCSELFENSSRLGLSLAAEASAAESRAPDLARLEALLSREHGPRAFLRSRPTRIRWLLALAVPSLLLVCECARGQVPAEALTRPRLLCAIVLAASLVWVTRSALGVPLWKAGAVSEYSALACCAWCIPGVLWFTTHAESAHITRGAPLFFGAFACFAYGSLLAAPSFVLALALDRRARVPTRVWLLAAGLVALVSNLILLFHCPNTDRSHLLLGHLSIGLVWFGAASALAFWGRRADLSYYTASHLNGP